MSSLGPPLRNVTGFVLAGGRSSRMGQDKALLQVRGEPLLVHALRRLQTVCGDVAILSGPPDPLRDGMLSPYARLVPDADSEHGGPLAALAAALAACSTEYAVLLAVDQPGLPHELIRSLVGISHERGSLAACFVVDNRPEPLPLLASPALLPGILRALHAGERRLLPTVQACLTALGQAMLLLPAPPGSAVCFTNLNTPDDLQRWRSTKPSNQFEVGASESSNG